MAIAVPMMIHGERPFVQVLIDGRSATLIVDTAALDTVIDEHALDDVSDATISLQIGDARMPKLRIAHGDVRSYAQRYLGAPADGIIGRDLLARYPVALDFPNRIMTVFRDSRSAAAAQAPGALDLPLRVIGGQPAVAGSLDGQQTRWFALATGASPQVQLDPSLARTSGLLPAQHSIPFEEPNVFGAASGTLVRARTLGLGKLSFNQPLVALVTIARAAPPELAGVLGAMTLSRLALLIDELASTVSLSATPGATAARLYEPSGIALELRGDTIVIRSVVPGTPADVAHLRAGDEIVSINGLAPATLDFARQLLDGSPGQKVTIVYRRWRFVHTAVIPLHVII
jgi:PDZ domain-containing protein